MRRHPAGIALAAVVGLVVLGIVVTALARRPGGPDSGRGAGREVKVLSVDQVFDPVGAWLDVFDFNPAHSGAGAEVGVDDIDKMAAAGVRTLYLQAARPEDPRAPGALVNPELLTRITVRAHQKGLAVVGWYLPHLSDLDADMGHLKAMIEFRAGGRPFDAIGLDIEWRGGVADPVVRSANLVELSRRLRAAAGAIPLGAIVLPPVLLEVVNPDFWPGFPWAGIKPYFDAWLPMSYWTDRTTASGFRDAHQNTLANVVRLRGHLGEVKIHMVGGVATSATTEDYRKFSAALAETGVAGRSVYDWASGGVNHVATIR